MNKKEYKFIVTQTRSGQNGPYSDYVNSYIIESEESPKTVEEFCKNVIGGGSKQSFKEWQMNSNDMSKYFSGYWKFSGSDGKYYYEVVMPFAD